MDEKTNKPRTEWTNEQTPLSERTNEQATNHQDGDWMSKQTNHQVSKLMAIQINKQMHKQPINQRNNRASKPPSERTETNNKCYTELFSINIKISLDLNSPLGKTWTNNIRKWQNKCNSTWWLNIACFKAHVVLHRAWTQTNTWTIVPIWPVFSQDRAWGGVNPPGSPLTQTLWSDSTDCCLCLRRPSPSSTFTPCTLAFHSPLNQMATCLSPAITYTAKKKIWPCFLVNVVV